MKRGIKTFSSKKGIELSMTELMYIILILAFFLMMFGIVYFMKNILK